MNLVKVKFVETGFLSVKQQTLPGLGEGNRVPFRREHGALNIDLTMAIDMAHAALSHTYKRYKFQVLVVNAKNNREEIAFEEEGQSETNPDEVVDEPAEKPSKAANLELVEGNGEKGKGEKKEKKKKAEGE